MSNKRAASMARIAKYSSSQTQILTPQQNNNPANIGAPVAIPAPYTQPTGKKIDAQATVGDTTEHDVRVITGVSTLGSTVNHGYDAGLKALAYARRKLESLPTPGGIIFPFVVLFFLFIVLLPVNGHTRLMWLWLAITGNAEIGGPLQQPTFAPITGGGAGGTFSYNTGSPSKNPNQVGVSPTSSTTHPATAMTNVVLQKTNKNSTTVHVNTTKNHVTSAKKQSSKVHGSGPGLYSGLVDPTAPYAQQSYSMLMKNYNGYE